MGVPYSQQISEYLDNHSYIKSGSTWRTAEEIHVKSGGTWRKTKEVWVKESGTWRLVHEGEHFLFNYHQTSPSTSEFSLSSWLNGQGYSSGPIKGVVNIPVSYTHLTLPTILLV